VQKSASTIATTSDRSEEIPEESHRSSSSSMELQDSDDKTCPICLHEDRPLAHGECRHGFCQPCLERLLLSPTISPRNDRQSAACNVVTPTLNVCPICRDRLYLFDLKFKETGKVLYEPCVHFHDTPLAGAVYADSQVGSGSFHFPPFAESENTEAYFNVENIPRLLDLPSHVPFKNVNLHWPSRTIAGVLEFPVGDFDRWNVYLSFSADWQFVCRGAMIKRRRKLIDAAAIRTKFPLDGSWSVTTTIHNQLPSQTQIHVQGHAFYNTAGQYHVLGIQRDRGAAHVIFNASRMQPTLEASSGLDVSRIPFGPGIGEAIEWKPIETDFIEKVEWKRLSVSTTLPPDEVNQVGGNSGRVYRLVSESTDALQSSSRFVPTYHPDTVWGNVFCQAFKVGLASYHFSQDSINAAERRVYISYENPATGLWPPLDNGMPIPGRAYFHACSFPDPHTFCGQIRWQEDFGIPWQGMIRWDFTIKFDSEFTCIVGGDVKSLSVYDAEVPHEMSRFGDSLIYVNAALWDVFVQARQQQDEQAEISALSEQRVGSPGSTSSTYERFQEHSNLLRQRLLAEGASVRTVAMVHGIFTKAQHENEVNPIDINM
jgi:hypothetical protein